KSFSYRARSARRVDRTFSTRMDTENTDRHGGNVVWECGGVGVWGSEPRTRTPNAVPLPHPHTPTLPLPSVFILSPPCPSVSKRRAAPASDGRLRGVRDRVGRHHEV